MTPEGADSGMHFTEEKVKVQHVSTVLAEDLNLYLYHTISDHTFRFNSTSNSSVTPATSRLENHFLVGAKLRGWKKKEKKTKKQASLFSLPFQGNFLR